MQSVINKFQSFLEEPGKNRWINSDCDKVKVYVRKGGRIINKKVFTSVDIANFEIDQDIRR